MTERKEISERLSRIRLMLKDERIYRLQDATVMVLGLGGVGSSCAEALARGGIGTLILIDRDTIEESNINRQALAFTRTVGRVKADVMREMVYEINPDCNVYTKQVFLTRDNIHEELGAFPRPDYVIDCIDTVTAKLMVYEWCIDEQLPVIAAMGAANKLDPTHLQFTTIEKTTHCPLSKVIRRECKKKGISKLEVLASNEIPVSIDHGQSFVKAETLGSMSYMPPIMGQMLAGKVICRLAGLEQYKLTPKRMKRSTNDAV